jgi:hypothetical protein
LSTFSSNATHENTAADLSSSGPTNIYALENIRFNNPITPQALETALEIREVADVDKIPDSFGDEAATWVPLSALYTIQYVSYYSRHLLANQIPRTVYQVLKVAFPFQNAFWIHWHFYELVVLALSI